MSPTPVPPVQEEPKKGKEELSSQRVTILSELDSYILERQKEQAPSLKEALERIEIQDTRPRHRLEMPEGLQKYFHHEKRNPDGPFIARWVYKTKRAIDTSLAKGWMIFNRSYFPDAPRYLFTANGGIEVGDVLLMFMPLKRGLELRAAPAKLSQERLKGQMTQLGNDYVLMTGNQQSDHVYKPELGPESSETSEAKVPGTLTEGRDF